MDVRELARLFRRWWWFLILGPLLAGAVAHQWSVRNPAGYEATATLIVNALGEPGTLGPDAPRGGEELARTYQELVVTWPVLSAVASDLDLDISVDDLRSRVNAEALSGTQLLRITASHSQPQAAADLANAVANTFVTYIVEQQSERIRAVEAEITAMIDDAQGQIAEIEPQIVELQAAPDADDPASQERITRLLAALDQAQSTEAYWQDRRREIDFSAASVADHVSIVTAAQPPLRQSSPDPLLSLLIGAAAGFLVVLGALVLREFAAPGPEIGAALSSRRIRLPMDQPL